MSISTLVTLGYGSFGSVSEIVTLGYSPGPAAVVTTDDVAWAAVNGPKARRGRKGLAAKPTARMPSSPIVVPAIAPAANQNDGFADQNFWDDVAARRRVAEANERVRQERQAKDRVELARLAAAEPERPEVKDLRNKRKRPIPILPTPPTPVFKVPEEPKIAAVEAAKIGPDQAPDQAPRIEAKASVPVAADVAPAVAKVPETLTPQADPAPVEPEPIAKAVDSVMVARAAALVAMAMLDPLQVLRDMVPVAPEAPALAPAPVVVQVEVPAPVVVQVAVPTPEPKVDRAQVLLDTVAAALADEPQKALLATLAAITGELARVSEVVVRLEETCRSIAIEAAQAVQTTVLEVDRAMAARLAEFEAGLAAKEQEEAEAAKTAESIVREREQWQRRIAGALQAAQKTVAEPRARDRRSEAH
jgi:hypothetical protein